MRRLLLLMIFIMIPLTVWPQAKPTATVHGFVYDLANGEALIGANVFLKENFRGGTTNLNGYFVIPKLNPGTYTLSCQYIGYKNHTQVVTVKTGEKKSVAIRLMPESIEGEEIVITADSIPKIQQLFDKPVSKIELTGKEINQIPFVAESDLLRSLQTLPGIMPISDFSTELYVRGGTPDQNLYMIDGTDVYNPEHMFGLFSTFNTDAIKKVDISKGGFGAEYGGRMSSILNVTNLDGNRERFEGNASVGLLAAKTTLQMPVGSFGSVSGSIRRTYFDQTIGRAIDEIPDYYFYDGNIKGFFELNNNNTLTVSGYGGRDVLNFVFNKNSDDQAGFDYNWGNRTGSVRWTTVLNPQLFANFWVTGSYFGSDFAFNEGTEFEEHNTITDLTFKGNLEYYHSPQFTLRFGFEQKNLHGRYKESFPGARVNAGGQRELYAVYGQSNWRPFEAWEIETGLRYNYFDSDKDYQNLDPRVTLKYKLNESVNLKGAFGIYHQYLHRISRPFFIGIWTSSDRYQSVSCAYHYILGYQQDMGSGWQVELEAYYKTYDRLYGLNQNMIVTIRPTGYDPDGTPVYSSSEGMYNEGRGHSSGLELLIKRETGVVTGWLGYSLSRTEYRFPDINRNVPYVPRHDRTVAVNLVCNTDLRNFFRKLKGRPPKNHKSKWLLGTNFTYTSGQPITMPGSLYYISPTPDGPPATALYPDDINAVRLPYYARLDLSLTWERRFAHWTFAPYVQVFNAGNRKNVWFVQYAEKDINDPNVVVMKTRTAGMFPVIPTLGLTAKF